MVFPDEQHLSLFSIARRIVDVTNVREKHYWIDIRTNSPVVFKKYTIGELTTENKKPQLSMPMLTCLKLSSTVTSR